MKWFKHHSNSHRDQTLKGIFRKYGLEGEARFWRLIELMAERFQSNEVHFDFDLETIRESLRFRSVNDCRPFLDLLTTLSRMNVEYSGNNCRIIYHKMLEIKDNHTNNLQVTNKQLASNLALEENKNKNKKRRENTIVNASVDYTHPLEITVSVDPSNEQKANAIGKIWNEYAIDSGLPKVKLPLSKDRVLLLKAPLQEFPEADDWESIIYQIQFDDFLIGKNDREWKAGFDWLIHKTKFNYRKLWEKYESDKNRDNDNGRQLSEPISEG